MNDLTRTVYQAVFEGRLHPAVLGIPAFCKNLQCSTCEREMEFFRDGPGDALVWPREKDWSPSDSVERDVAALLAREDIAAAKKSVVKDSKFQSQEAVISLLKAAGRLKGRGRLEEALHASDLAFLATEDRTHDLVHRSLLRSRAYVEIQDISRRMGAFFPQDPTGEARWLSDLMTISFYSLFRPGYPLYDGAIDATRRYYAGLAYFEANRLLAGVGLLITATVLYYASGLPDEAELVLERLVDFQDDEEGEELHSEILNRSGLYEFIGGSCG